MDLLHNNISFNYIADYKLVMAESLPKSPKYSWGEGEREEGTFKPQPFLSSSTIKVRQHFT